MNEGCRIVAVMSALLLAGMMFTSVGEADETPEEVIVARTFVPSPSRRVGEVRLVRLGEERLVRTLLYTKLLERVVREIVSKEQKNWPAPIDGHGDAERYIETIRAAEAAIPKPRGSGPNIDRTRRLLIEFRVDDDKGTVSFATFAASGPREDLQVTSRESLASIEVTAAYARRNMDLIAADAFGVAEPEVPDLWKGTPPGEKSTSGAASKDNG